MLIEDVFSMSLSQIKEDNVTRIKALCREITKEASALAWSSHDLAWSSGIEIKLLHQGQRCIFNGHTSYVARLAFNPDGKLLASGSHDFTARLWNVESCNERIVFSDHQNMVVAVAFSPDGKLLATAGSEERCIKLRNIETGNLLTQLQAPGSDSCVSVEFSPDGSSLAAADLAAKVWLWDIKRGQLLNAGTHNDMVMDVAFSPDGKLVASASHDGSVCLWRHDLSELYHQFNVGAELFCVAFHPSGKILVAGDLEGKIHLWNVETFQSLGTLSQHTKTIADIAFNPEGTLLASVSLDDSLILWGA